MEFEWDRVKEQANLLKHGFGFSEAVEVFSDPKGLVLEDESHSGSERRFYWVGKSSDGKILTVRFTRRANKIRIFGCAHWRKFRRLYEAAQNEES
jgi:hypothetical protein